MKKQIGKGPFKIVTVFIFIVTALFYGGACRKDIKNSIVGKTEAATSQIIYSNVIPDTTFYDNTTFHLDLNNDGITDFDVSANWGRSLCPTARGRSTNGVTSLITIRSYGSNSMADTTINPNGASPRLYALPSNGGSEINQDALVWSGADSVLTITSYISCSVGIPGPSWGGVTDKYLGLRLVVGSSIFFGWLRLSAAVSAFAGNPILHVTIKDYAFNSVPGRPILAGQTK